MSIDKGKYLIINTPTGPAKISLELTQTEFTMPPNKYERKPKHDWTLVHIFLGDKKQEILDYISKVQDAKIVNTGVVFDHAILVMGGNKTVWKQLAKEYDVEIIPDLVC